MRENPKWLRKRPRKRDPNELDPNPNPEEDPRETQTMMKMMMMAKLMALDPWRLQTGGEDEDEVTVRHGELMAVGEKGLTDGLFKKKTALYISGYRHHLVV